MSFHLSFIFLGSRALYLFVDINNNCPSKVKSVDTDAKTLTFEDGTVQHYDQLLISTGGRLDHNFLRS